MFTSQSPLLSEVNDNANSLIQLNTPIKKSRALSPPSPAFTLLVWLESELTDSSTGEKFSVSDFKGKIVLIESFAVWCPTCLKQQLEMQKLNEISSKEIIHISLDTDPNEDVLKVKAHKEQHGFDWYFSVSPIETTQSFINEFGFSFVSAPTLPVVMVCENQKARFLPLGLSAEGLLNEINSGC